MDSLEETPLKLHEQVPKEFPRTKPSESILEDFIEFSPQDKKGNPRYVLDTKIFSLEGAEVYKGEDRKTGRKIIAKTLDKNQNTSERGESIEKEARLLARLEGVHGIPRVIDLLISNSEEADKPKLAYMIMEYVEGTNMSELFPHNLFKTDEGISEFVGIMTSLCRTVDELAERDVYNADIKPGNIIVHDGPATKNQAKATLIDFGFSPSIYDQKAAHESDELLRGTMGYVAPELRQDEEFHPNSIQSEIYSLGKVAIGLITRYGNDFHTRSYVMELVAKHVGDEKAEALQKVIIRATSEDPENRFKSGKEFSKAIKGALFD